MIEINFNSDKEWEFIKSEIFKKNPEYSNSFRDILLRLQVLLDEIDSNSNVEIQNQLIVEYLGFKDMYIRFINCLN